MYMSFKMFGGQQGTKLLTCMIDTLKFEFPNNHEEILKKAADYARVIEDRGLDAREAFFLQQIMDKEAYQNLQFDSLSSGAIFFTITSSTSLGTSTFKSLAKEYKIIT